MVSSMKRPTVYCAVCDRKYSYSNMARHRRSKKHKSIQEHSRSTQQHEAAGALKQQKQQELKSTWTGWKRVRPKVEEDPDCYFAPLRD